MTAQTPSTGSRSCLGYVFLSPSERRLRAGWRLTLQAALQIALTAAAVLAGLIILLLWGNLSSALSQTDSLPALALGEVVELVTVTLSVLVARRFLDRRSFVSLGLTLRGTPLVDVAVGIGITFVIMGLIFAAEAALGWLKLSTFAWTVETPSSLTINLLIWLAVFILVGWSEELMSRGYHLQTIASGMGLTWGLLISSAIFGMLHLYNPNATWFSAVGILFAGLLLGFAYIRTGRLWLSIGLHIGWNFFEGVVFGFPVSGLNTYRLAQTTVHGPTLWTGGAFGPEAGLIVLPAILLAILLVYVYTISSGSRAEIH